MRIGSVKGIDIKVDASWLFIAALVAWNFWARFTTVDGKEGGVALAMAAGGAVLFFGSILLHELAHALEAQRRGVDVHGITLFLFGGVTETKFEVRRPMDELALTIVGPLTSLALAGILGVVATTADNAGITTVGPVVGLIAWLNLALAIFNMLPGAPLDGGRVLRAIVWKVTGDRDRSVRVAVRSGQLLGGALIGFGLLQLFAGAAIGGLWMAFIGWFLLRAATAELVQHMARRLLDGVSAGRLASSVPSIPASTSVAEAVDGWLAEQDVDALIVEDDGRPSGVLTVDDIKAVDRGGRSDTSVGSVMRRLDDLPKVDADGGAEDVLDQLQSGEIAVAVDGDRVVGLVTPDRVLRYLKRVEMLEGRST